MAFVRRPTAQVSNRTLLVATSIAIFVYGMIAALAGTIVPQLSSRLNLSPQQIGNIFSAQALGMIIASVAAGPLAGVYCGRGARSRNRLDFV